MSNTHGKENRIHFDGIANVLSDGTDKRGGFMTVAGVYHMWCQVLHLSHAKAVKAARVEMEAATLACYKREGCTITGDARERERLDRAVHRYKRLVNDGAACPDIPANLRAE